MTKVRKVKKRKTYRYGVNRKRLNRKVTKKAAVACAPMKNAWDKKKSTQTNFKEMGLSYDANETIKIPTNKPSSLVSLKPEEVLCDKSYVAMEIEENAKAPRVKKFRLPNSQVYWLSKLLDKYGDDYKAMARDTKLNYFQETWKQLRSKVKVFKSIPDQYGEYLKKREEAAQEA